MPFLGPALGYLTVQCAARGGEIWFYLTGMICPLAGNLTANFWKMSSPHPMPCLPPPCQLYIDRCISQPFLNLSCLLLGQVLLVDLKDYKIFTENKTTHLPCIKSLVRPGYTGVKAWPKSLGQPGHWPGWPSDKNPGKPRLARPMPWQSK